MNKPMLVLIAGPYRSGTDGDPDRIAANLRRLESAAWPIHAKGHIPMIGEWVALPVLRGAADQSGTAEAAERGVADRSGTAEAPEGDVMYDVADQFGAAEAPEGEGMDDVADQSGAAYAPEGDVMYDVAGRLLQHCDAVLRLTGESHGADRDVEIAKERGLPIYHDAAEIPAYVPQ
ncbi:DUF4406 domain-containing protein [Kribbella sp. CA-253562]|uniref:DUF4406 domain-containing protein n=1 Tax=Kribbella sp. CA-253562 TaxID=3239942 RepID=UPI003D9133ED